VEKLWSEVGVRFYGYPYYPSLPGQGVTRGGHYLLQSQISKTWVKVGDAERGSVQIQGGAYIDFWGSIKA
jgi:hypothetical protein